MGHSCQRTSRDVVMWRYFFRWDCLLDQEEMLFMTARHTKPRNRSIPKLKVIVAVYCHAIMIFVGLRVSRYTCREGLELPLKSKRTVSCVEMQLEIPWWGQHALIRNGDKNSLHTFVYRIQSEVPASADVVVIRHQELLEHRFMTVIAPVIWNFCVMVITI